MEVIVISIGTLSKNPLWGEKTPVRTSHATTVLLRSGKANILIDPSLPPQLLEARIFERTGLQKSAITHVFLTNWRPVHRRALAMFDHAQWWMNAAEMQTAGEILDATAARAKTEDQPVDALMAQERNLLRRVKPAPDVLTEGVDLFPLPGYTPGQSGLLVSLPTSSIIIAGDAVPTAGHFAAGQVFQESFDIEKAKESLLEMYEIADVIIPGHDNVFLNPRAAGL